MRAKLLWVGCALSALVVIGVSLVSGGIRGSSRTGPSPEPWAAHLAAMDRALAVANPGEAAREWVEAHRLARLHTGWLGLIEVGHASLRLDRVVPGHRTPRLEARRAYLGALVRARAAGSIDGLLQASEAFAALGDREMAERSIDHAGKLAAARADADTQERLRDVAAALADRFAPRGQGPSGPGWGAGAASD